MGARARTRGRSIGMRAEADAFFFFVLCTWVNMLTAMLVGFCVAACLPGDVAPMVTLPCFATLNTLVTGFLVSISTMPSARAPAVCTYARLAGADGASSLAPAPCAAQSSGAGCTPSRTSSGCGAH